MLDGVDSRGTYGKSGGPFNSLDEINIGGDQRLIGKIYATEDESVVLRGRLEGERNFFPGVKGGAFERRGRGESVLHVSHGEAINEEVWAF